MDGFTDILSCYQILKQMKSLWTTIEALSRTIKPTLTNMSTFDISTNQDPLESFFGNQRQMHGGNEAPNVSQFNEH